MATQQQSSSYVTDTVEQNLDPILGRVAYLFKFTQQSILLIDSESEWYGTLGRHYLGHRPDSNAAFISVNEKMTDIQFRCRVIEQLSPNSIFDPEKPLADTVVNLLTSDAKDISIVIEHTQHLSTQILKELLAFPQQYKSMQPGCDCQILFLGNEEAHTLCNSPAVAEAYDVIQLSARTGKPYINSQTKLDASKNKTKNLPLIPIFVGGLTLLLIISMSMLVFNSGTSDYAQLPEPTMRPTTDAPIIAQTRVETDKPVSVDERNQVDEQAVKLDKQMPISEPAKATGKDVFIALTTSDNRDVIADQAVEVSPEEKPSVILESNTPVINSVVESQATSNTVDIPTAFGDGFHIQFAVLSNKNAVHTYIQNFTAIPLTYYQRKSEISTSYVIVSHSFSSKKEATDMLSTLTKSEGLTGLWIKSGQSIKREIQ